ncbi:imidazole glycerol phosphate synthase cyclase subunit [Methylobacillus gramineus]|uniref:imidazole glycerol phosphate synthase subunit HisF n=1 Tax=Methylobacillus gramineus TaxID=755169 RepID=UPI001CFF5FEB|nr:imidazole glycerol phosphate synthase cyclase subunit [Methylobacillus gramineus]MCB5184115.1 imidazole glycerol phosphate synthase cyclase subunit [Methylobacillus gramineus]
MRLIARLDVKNEHVIKGIHFEGLRKVGNPIEMAKNYYAQGIDEIVFIDAVASLYNRNNLLSVIAKASEEVFVPITVGGGLRSIADIEMALSAGADKVAVNTAAILNPGFITEIAKRYGSQCVVASIQAKRIGHDWEAYMEAGREPTGKKVVAWSKELEDLGAGEILLTSIDQDGTKKGFDLPLLRAVNTIVNIPVMISGGCGNTDHVQDLKEIRPSGVCLASVLHYKINTIDEFKQRLTSINGTR